MSTDWGTSTDGFHEWAQDYADGDVTLSVAAGKGSIVLAGDTDGSADTGLVCTTGPLDTWRTGAAIWSGRFALPEWSTDTNDIELTIYPWDRAATPTGYIGFGLYLSDDTGLGVVGLFAHYDGDSAEVDAADVPLTAPAMGDVYLRAELGVWFDPDLCWIRIWADGDPRPDAPTLVLALPFSAFTALSLRHDTTVGWDGTDPHTYEYLFDYWRYAAITIDDVPTGCWVDPPEGVLDTFNRTPAGGTTGATSYGNYLWVDQNPGTLNMNVVGNRWQADINDPLDIGPDGSGSASERTAVQLPLDPASVVINLSVGIELPEPTGPDDVSGGTFRLTIDRYGPTNDETYYVILDMIKEYGADDWTSTLTIHTPDGPTDFGTLFNGSLFAAAGLAVTISPTAIGASAGGLTGSVSYTADATQDPELTTCGLEMRAFLENNIFDSSHPGGVPAPADVANFHVWADTLIVTSDRGNCVEVAHG